MSVFVSIVVGILFGFFWSWFTPHYLSWDLDFRLTGLLTPIFFLPSILVAAFCRSPRLGTIAFAETLAAGIAAFFGPLGLLSLHFGFFQGLFAEIAYRLKKSILSVAMAMLAADALLLLTHPRLFEMRERHAVGEWLIHFLGLIVSSLALVFLFRKLIKLLPALLAFVVIIPTAHSDPCAQMMVHLSQFDQFHVVLDYDDTVVDTSSLLAAEVVPAVFQSKRSQLSPSAKEEVDRFLDQPIELPSTYRWDVWRSEFKGFPWTAIDESYEGSSKRKLQQFWKEMSVFFDQLGVSAQVPPTQPHVAEAVSAIKKRYDQQVQWVVLTARQGHQAAPIKASMQGLGLGTCYRLITRVDYGRSSVDNACYKLRALEDLHLSDRPVGLFLEDDESIISSVGQLIPGLMLVRVTKHLEIVSE